MQKLFEVTFGDLPPDAVPSSLINQPTNPLVVQAHNDAGDLIGAALTCRPMLVSRWMVISRSPAPLRDAMVAKVGFDLSAYESAPDLVHDLDLIAVRSGHRGERIGQGMIDFVEPLLVEMGVHALIGHATAKMGGERVRSFYEKCGFNVLRPGQRLPKFAGRTYSVPRHLLREEERPLLAFYKVIGPLPENLPKAAVMPPKAKKKMLESARRNHR